nr:ribonuclease H-like domain-containing protein [Tanacetum cinerariifolium]
MLNTVRLKVEEKSEMSLELRRLQENMLRDYCCCGRLDAADKFDGKDDEGFFVGYSLNSKAYRVFNNRTKIVEVNLHIRFSENTPNIAGSRPNWLFDIDELTNSMNYKSVITRNQSNGNAESKNSQNDDFQPSSDDEKKVDEVPRQESKWKDQEKEYNDNSTNYVNAAGIIELM